jgi:hypothetical protein
MKPIASVDTASVHAIVSHAEISGGLRSERFQELDDLITAGWGETPQLEIPDDWRERAGPDEPAPCHSQPLVVKKLVSITFPKHLSRNLESQCRSMPLLASCALLGNPAPCNFAIRSVFVADAMRFQKWPPVTNYRQPFDRHRAHRVESYKDYARIRGIRAVRIFTENQPCIIWCNDECLATRHPDLNAACDTDTMYSRDIAA